MAKKKVVRKKTASTDVAKKAAKNPPKKTVAKSALKKAATKTTKKTTKKTAVKSALPAALQATEFAEMSSAWFRKAREALTLYNKTTGDLIHSRHRLGQIVIEMTSDENAYGTKSIRKLAKALRVKPGDLYNSRDLALAYSGEQIDALISRGQTVGHVITASHLAQLARLGPTAKKTREQLEVAMLKNKMSVEELGGLVTKKLGSRSSSNRGGRQPNRPTSVRGGVRQIKRQFSSLLRYMPGWEEVVVAGVTSELLDKETTEEVLETRRDIQSLREKLDVLDQAYENALNVLSASAGEVVSEPVEEAEAAEDEAAEDEEWEYVEEGEEEGDEEEGWEIYDDEDEDEGED